MAGFCKFATLEDVRKNNYVFTPARYVSIDEEENRLNALIQENLAKVAVPDK